MKINKGLRSFFLLPMLSGILLWLAWPPLPFTLLIFIALTPVLINQEFIYRNYQIKKSMKLWFTDFLALLIFNICTTWWISATYLGTHEAGSLIAGIFSNVANALLMTLPLIAFRFTKKYLGEGIGFMALICYWMAFEYLHLRWELTWPWLTIGNVFAYNHTWIQWYAWTGVFGGTAWVWVLNIFIYIQLKKYIFPSPEIPQAQKPIKKYFPAAGIILCIALPILISKQIYLHTNDIGKPIQVEVVQPNINPYTEKFDLPYTVQLKKMLALAAERLNDSTDFLVFPETAIPDPIWLNRNPSVSRPVTMIRALTDNYPRLTTVIGINAYEEYATKAESTVTARQLINQRKKDTVYIDAFNTAILLDSSDNIPFYHKSKLVPGVERMPYPGALKFLNYFVMDMGGISGSLGTQKERTPLCNKNGICIATVICYESIYGEYITRYVKNGANVIFIITNDGWWANTAGHVQHALYAKLRAIETRKSIARSANTGTSCFINQRGDMSMQTAWEKDAVLNETLYENDIQTFYTKHGDYIARIGLWTGILLFLLSVLFKFRKKLKHHADL